LKQYQKIHGPQSYQKNKHIIIQRATKYNQEHKEERKENQKKYYEQNRDKILKKNKEQIVCECGSVISKYKKTKT